MPCCHIPTPANPIFPPSLVPDAERFARYVGGAPLGNGPNDVGAPVPTAVLTSGLHLEMKLWQPNNPMPLNRYLINAHFGNSWTAMLAGWLIPQLGERFSPQEKTEIEKLLSLPNPVLGQQRCILTPFDNWALNLMVQLRQMGQDAGRNPIPPGAGHQTTALASYGRCQKLINIYLKYGICWQVAGQWINGFFVPYNAPPLPQLPQYLCALHAPIDRILLAGPQKQKGKPKRGGIVNLPLGAWLVQQNLLMNNGDLWQSSDGQFRCWSKLDCLRTYYGLQLMLRRVAMQTWPKGCSCAPSPQAAIQKCADWFNETYPAEPSCVGPDWVQAACELPDSVIEETIRQLSGGRGIDDSSEEETGSPQGESVAVKGKRRNRQSETGDTKENAAKAGSQSQKEVIFLNEQSRRGGPHNFALRIVAACGDKMNLGAICKKHNCLDAHQELVDMIKSAGGNLMGETPRCRVAGICPTGVRRPGSTCCWNGSGYVAGVHFDSTESAVRYLKRYFDVRACSGNKTWDAATIQRV